MSIFSQRLSRIQPSPTIAITSKAKKLKQEGKQIIDFSAGEPDFDTPDNVKKVAIEAINNGQTKYTPVNGTKELIESIIKKFKRENDLVFEPDEITVGCGGKQVIFNALLATIEKGDEIIIAPPITNIKEASQLLNKLKNPITFSGFVIPDITRPMPNINPHTKDIIFSFIRD